MSKFKCSLCGEEQETIVDYGCPVKCKFCKQTTRVRPITDDIQESDILHYEIYITDINDSGLRRAGYTEKPRLLVKDIKKFKKTSDHLHFIFTTLEDEKVYILKSHVKEMRIQTIYKEG